MNRKSFRPLALCFTLTLLAASAFAATFDSARPSTTNNDDSCDIAVQPAATLLLPYFEVEVETPVIAARTTIFTVINTSRFPQITRTTLWTDRGYPVLWFNSFLTGYDVQAYNVYDLIARGIIAPERGTSNGNTPGSRSLGNTGNPNFLPDVAETCTINRMPVQIPANIINDMQNALSTGIYSRCGTTPVGGDHRRDNRKVAVGYITVDLVATCSVKGPRDTGYFSELLYDNVLTGDYEIISPNFATGNYAGGNPLVHIRAIPEGGAAGSSAETSLPYTFYDRLTPATTRTIDRRQPLPSTFSARFIQGGPTAFNTDFQIWREPLTAAASECDAYAANNRAFIETVRFDERENPTTFSAVLDPPTVQRLPSTSRIASSNTNFPPLTTGDLAGWMYLNLNAPSTNLPGGRATQNWVSVNMAAEGRFSVLMDSTMLGNGCSPPKAVTGDQNPIGPASNN
jgi:hypothetical protein